MTDKNIWTATVYGWEDFKGIQTKYEQKGLALNANLISMDKWGHISCFYAVQLYDYDHWEQKQSVMNILKMFNKS